jgi:UDP-N-acetylglucosamine 2-epimerase (non-hydrolysing)
MIAVVGERTALVVMGTRPEAIKLAPVVTALERAGQMRPYVVATSQHRQLLRQALEPFSLVPDVDLDLMAEDQSPSRVAAEVLSSVEPILRQQQPRWTVVQGDTTTAVAAAMASFHAGVPVAHVEAGLRTGRMDAPFPEEFNRRAISLVASSHFAPTQWAVDNLLREGVDSRQVHLVGNTVVDAVRWIRSTAPDQADPTGPPLILLTLHRRESFGEPLERVLGAIRQLVEERGDQLRVLYPVHPNPRVSEPAQRVLGGLSGVELVAPMDYPGFLAAMAAARFVLSDSGGVQEEAPSLGVPVLVLREVTERPELVESGWGRVVGTSSERILEHARLLLDNEHELEAMRRGPNPFGDGRSGERIARVLAAEVNR